VFILIRREVLHRISVLFFLSSSFAQNKGASIFLNASLFLPHVVAYRHRKTKRSIEHTTHTHTHQRRHKTCLRYLFRSPRVARAFARAPRGTRSSGKEDYVTRVGRGRRRRRKRKTATRTRRRRVAPFRRSLRIRTKRRRRPRPRRLPLPRLRRRQQRRRKVRTKSTDWRLP